MPKTIDFALELNSPQWRAQRVIAPRRTIFYGWGRGVGKSWFTRLQWWRQVALWDRVERPGALDGLRGVRITAIMPTLKQFRGVHWEGIERELGKGGPWYHLGAKLNRNEGQILFPGGSWIKPFPASAYNSQTARGMRCDILSADEVDDIDMAVYDGVAVPWLSEPWSLGIELQGGTPTRGRYGLWYRSLKSGELGRKLRRGEIEESAALDTDQARAVVDVFAALDRNSWPLGIPEDPEQAALHVLRNFYSFHATYRDAPETVSPLAVAKAKATTPAATFKREWEADPDAAEGLVYGDVFHDKFHVRSPPENQAWTDILIGCDHGWEHPGVMLLIGVAGKGADAQAWVLRELYAQRQSDTWWKDKLREWVGWYPRHLFYGDPSQPRTLDAYKHECKARVRDTDNSVEEGIRAVADRLVTRERDGQEYARLYVDPCCVNTIREFGLYRRKRDPRNSDAYLDDVEKRNDDAMDALRYAIFNFFGPAPGGRNTRHLEDRQ